MSEDINKEKLAALRLSVELRLGHGVNTPSEFKRLSEDIKQQLGRAISQSTLMRLWGYVNSTTQPNASTLDALSIYAGYHDFASFNTSINEGSDTVLSESINVDSDLSPRDHIELRWSGNHVVLARHLGGAQFVVEHSENSKLTVGDTFTCHLFIQGQPLYLDNLVHQSMAPRCYVCGKSHGVNFKVIPAVK